MQTKGGGGSPNSFPQTKGTIVGRNEMYKRETLVWPLLVHKLLGHRPPLHPRSKDAPPRPRETGSGTPSIPPPPSPFNGPHTHYRTGQRSATGHLISYCFDRYHDKNLNLPTKHSWFTHMVKVPTQKDYQGEAQSLFVWPSANCSLPCIRCRLSLQHNTENHLEERGC